MKRKNMKVGLHVVVKDCAVGIASLYKGETLVIERLDDDLDGYVDNVVFFPQELRKATPDEIAAYEQEKNA